MLKGFTPPYTVTGQSALVPAPPWHYAGNVFSFSIEVDPEVAQSFLPNAFGNATGVAYAHFCEWQSTTTGWELLDPIYAQYKEFFLLIEAQKSESLRLFCPFIYVDQDISMTRGLLQGWPKKMGQVWMTRSLSLNHPAAAPLSRGSKLGASLAVKDRRLAEGSLTLTGEVGERLGFLAIPTFGLLGQATLVDIPSPGVPRLVRQIVTDIQIGTISAATGAFQLFESPRDELGMLNALTVTTATVCEVGLTIVGIQEVVE